MSLSSHATQPSLGLNAALDCLRPLRHSGLRAISPFVMVVLALLLTWLAGMLWESSALLIFAAIIAIASGLFGLVVGLFTAFLSILTVDLIFLPPAFQLTLNRSALLVTIEYTLFAMISHFGVRYLSAAIRSKAKLGVFGQLDGVVDGEAYGWALDADNRTVPVSVLIYVDQRPVAETAAVYYRPDVATLLNGSGRYGFYVDISSYCRPGQHVIVEARLSPNTPLGSPAPALVPAFVRRIDRPAVLYMHVPRTAGTAFREAITANYRQAEIAYLYPDPPGFLVETLRHLPLQQRAGFRLVVGHFRFGVHEWLPQESTYISVIRHPVSRVLSHYLYLVKNGSPSIYERDRLLSPEEYMEKQCSVDMDNAMVRYFGGIDDTEFPPGTLGPEQYEKAICHMRTRFAYVGLQETSQGAFDALCRHFAWTSATHLERVNLATDALELTKQEHLRIVVEYHNRWDCLFHDQALQTFQSGPIRSWE